MDGIALQPQPAVARHGLGDVDEQCVRDRVSRVGQQRVDDLLGVVARCSGVPQAQRREAVGVDVLGRALELGERRDLAAAGFGLVVIDLEQQGLVALDDQGSVGHVVPSDGRTVIVPQAGPSRRVDRGDAADPMDGERSDRSGSVVECGQPATVQFHRIDDAFGLSAVVVDVADPHRRAARRRRDAGRRGSGRTRYGRAGPAQASAGRLALPSGLRLGSPGRRQREVRRMAGGRSNRASAGRRSGARRVAAPSDQRWIRPPPRRWDAQPIPLSRSSRVPASRSEARTVGASRRKPSAPASGSAMIWASIASSSQRTNDDAAADPQPAVLPGNVVDEVGQRLRNRCAGHPGQEGVHVGGRLTGVESPPDRRLP